MFADGVSAYFSDYLDSFKQHSLKLKQRQRTLRSVFALLKDSVNFSYGYSRLILREVIY